jgi:hypothetical protein
VKKLWANKWFILVVIMFLFFAATATKAVSAGQDENLTKILGTGVDGLIAFFDWLIDVLKQIWV